MKVKISGSILTNLFSSVSAGCVGKSSIVLRYTEDKFNTSHLTTLQVCTRHDLQHTKGVRRFLYIYSDWGGGKGLFVLSGDLAKISSEISRSVSEE